MRKKLQSEFTMKKLFSGVLFVLILSCANIAFAYSVVDNSLSDWGIDPNANSWTPNSGVVWTGYHPGTSPGAGGSDYDVLAMYGAYDAGKGYIAIVTGFPQAGRYHDTAAGTNSSNKYLYPGDIAIDFGKDGTYEYGIKTGNHVGVDIGGGKTSGGLSGNPGDVYAVPAGGWGTAYEGTGYENVWNKVSDPTVIQSGTKIGSTPFSYYQLGNYYAIETYLPIDSAGFSQTIDWSQPASIHWTMTCGNDFLKLDVPAMPVPEPASLSLLGLGFMGLIFSRRRISGFGQGKRL